MPTFATPTFRPSRSSSRRKSRARCRSAR
jgi:hypothetical protein